MTATRDMCFENVAADTPVMSAAVLVPLSCPLLVADVCGSEVLLSVRCFSAVVVADVMLRGFGIPHRRCVEPRRERR